MSADFSISTEDFIINFCLLRTNCLTQYHMGPNWTKLLPLRTCLDMIWHQTLTSSIMFLLLEWSLSCCFTVFSEVHCSALTLLWDLCCGQNDPERIGTRCWISQLQCPESRRLHISHSTLDRFTGCYWPLLFRQLAGHMPSPSNPIVHEFHY